ncbi:SpoIID/LytB domain-containing protein [Eubacteriales bacterium OttesenSCG-928-A19]|nr:SpoIID/LytB domain-containing protein [Eubacteriales bacterium OttesenSCG-928-A19]
MKVTVEMTRVENVQRYGKVATLDMEEYLKGVLPSEVYESGTPEQAKWAQAICARTFALRRTLDGGKLDDTSKTQNFRATLMDTSPLCAQAVEDTAGVVLMYEGQPIHCYYSSSNGGETKRTDQVWSRAFPYYKCRPDVWDATARAVKEASGRAVKLGHGVGLSQIGAEYAAQLGENYRDILAFYYPGAVTDLIHTTSGSAEGNIIKEENDMGIKAYPIMVDLHTKNDCYLKAVKTGERMIPQGIMVHSVGCKGTRYVPRWQKWNTPDFKKCVHGFIDDAEPGIYQTLPYDFAGWHCAGAGNKTHIAFEICEPTKDTPENAADLYAKTLYFCTWLCRKYSIPPEYVISHAEGYKMGIANNHSDVGHWWGKKGTPWEPYTMDRLRAEIAAELNLPSEFPCQAQVVTKKDPLGVWSIPGANAKGRTSLGKLPKDSIAQVVGRSWLPGWYLVIGDEGKVGHSDGQHLLPMEPTVDEDQEENLADIEEMTPPDTCTVVVPDADADTVSWLLENYPGAYTLPDAVG